VFCFLVFGCQYQCNQLPGKNRLWNDLLCLEWDVKPYTLTHSALSVHRGASIHHIVSKTLQVEFTQTSNSLEVHMRTKLLQQATVFHHCWVFAEPSREHDHLTHSSSHHITRHNVRKHGLHTKLCSVLRLFDAATKVPAQIWFVHLNWLSN